MSKDPTPKADGLRAMREATRGHLQADGAYFDRMASRPADTPKTTPYAGKPKSPGRGDELMGKKNAAKPKRKK